jgi:hypothetical protein
MRRTIIAVCATALAAAAAALAGNGDREQVHLNAADTAAARAAVLRRSDLPPPAEWKGGMKKPDLSARGARCANFQPKRSDLVVTGVAESDFSRAIFHFDSLAKVFKTARMLRLDWQRVALAPGLLPCLRHYLAKGIPAGMKIVSILRLSFPHVAEYTYAARAVVDVAATGRKLRLLLDFAMIGRGRTGIELLTAAPYADRANVQPEETRLMRILVARTRT